MLIRDVRQFLQAWKRPETAQYALREPVEHFRLGDGSEEEATVEQVAKRAKQEKGVANPRLYRVRTKGKSERLLDGCKV